jgi:hypothetical protein
MRIRNTQNSAFALVCFALLLVVLFFGLRGRIALEAGTYVATSSAENLRNETDHWMPDTLLINQKARYLQGAVMAERDPFGDPPKKKVQPKPKESEPKSTKPVKPKAVKLYPPTLRAHLFDTVNPSVKLSKGGKDSGWLHRGDEFRGWMVVEITPYGVTVSKNSKTFDLDR